MSRAHLHLPLTNSSGAVFPYASVTLNNEDGSPLGVDVFVQPVGGNPIDFPLFVDPAVIDVWLDVPSRVQIVAEVSDHVRIVQDSVDIMPPPAQIAQTPVPLTVTGTPLPGVQSILMSSTPEESTFHAVDLVGTHEHEGDSAGSVVLTGEAPADFDPYQSWVGYHVGENIAPSSAGSSALGGQASLYGAFATLLGPGQVTAQPATGLPGDYATALSSDDVSTLTGNSTTVGAANLTNQGRNMTVIGSANGPSSPDSMPNNSTVIGPGNVIGAQGALKIGADHPASGAGPNHTTIGSANIAQQNGLPWAGTQVPIAIGANKTLAGDPSDVSSSTDWFGGAGPLAIGTNTPAFDPSLINVSGTMATQVALRVVGDVVVNGHPTSSGTSTTLGFFGTTGISRPQIAVNPNDVTNTMLTTVMAHLSKTGLLYTVATPILAESGAHPDGTLLEFAETGQALQWKLPPTSTDYRTSNAFTVTSNKIVLNAARAPFPTRGLPAVYSCGRADVTVQGRFGYNPTGTNAITNPDFETNTTNWGNWDSSTISRVTTKAKYGDACLKINGDGSHTGARASHNIPVTLGQQLNFSAYINPDTALASRISVEWLDSSFAYLGSSGIFTQDQTAPVNTWTRVNVGATVPAGAAYAACNVGWFTQAGNVPVGNSIYVDAAQVTLGSTALQTYVDASGFHPDDQVTGLMIRSYLAQSLSGGQPIAVNTGYLVGRKSVYAMAGNTITSTVATLSTSPAAGDLLQADCSGTGVTIRVNGTSVATFTDSTLNGRVKHGYRVCPTTSAWGLQVYPFGF